MVEGVDGVVKVGVVKGVVVRGREVLEKLKLAQRKQASMAGRSAPQLEGAVPARVHWASCRTVLWQEEETGTDAGMQCWSLVQLSRLSHAKDMLNCVAPPWQEKHVVLMSVRKDAQVCEVLPVRRQVATY